MMRKEKRERKALNKEKRVHLAVSVLEKRREQDTATERTRISV